MKEVSQRGSTTEMSRFWRLFRQTVCCDLGTPSILKYCLSSRRSSGRGRPANTESIDGSATKPRQQDDTNFHFSIDQIPTHRGSRYPVFDTSRLDSRSAYTRYTENQHNRSQPFGSRSSISVPRPGRVHPRLAWLQPQRTQHYELRHQQPDMYWRERHR